MPKTKKNDYGNESIKSLKGADRVRKRPSVIFGSDGIEGCEHSFFEILSNSIDEAREGHGDKIVVTFFRDRSIEIEDFGRGVPVDFNQKEQRFNWELVYCELYAGGKYNTIDGESYEYSLGLNGLGACATQYSSEYMDVQSFRDGMLYSLHFEHGVNVGGLQKVPNSKKRTGTITRWRPDLEVFTDIAISREYAGKTIKRQAVVNPGLLFILRFEEENGFSEQQFFYEKGIEDYARELLGEEKPIAGPLLWNAERRGRDRADKPEYKVKLSVCLAFSSRLQLQEYYHSSSFLEHGGSPEKAVRMAFVSQFDSFLKQSGKYKANESKITFVDIQDCLLLISSSFSTMTSYENQTKKSITNKFIYECMTEFLKHQLEVFFLENPDDAGKIADQILINKRSREESERSRLDIKKKLSGNIDIANRVQKFVDCTTKDLALRELYIVEGDSALGSCKQAREAEFQAIIPVRGKILNCLKAEPSQIFKNEIITDIIKVLGCGVEMRRGAGKNISAFDLSQLRWSKIIICTDADVDGFHIRAQILTLLYCLTPTLIEKGLVYIAESPLYEITCGAKTFFAYSEKEKAAITGKLQGQKHTIQRSKGLGENEPDMMWLTTMNPETRRLIKVIPDGARETAEMFELLLGDNLQGRKDLIAHEGHKYLDLTDVS